YRVVFLAYAAAGVLLAVLFTRLSYATEAAASKYATDRPAPRPAFLGLYESRGVVLKLSGLFALDAFAGGFVLQSLVVYWFHLRFDADPAILGGVFFAANLLAGVSAL